MYHLKPNKLIIFDSYLSLQYNIQVTENLNLYQNPGPSREISIGKATGLNFIGDWYYNGRKLEKPTKIRIYQKISTLSKEDLRKIAQRITEVEIDIDRVFSSLEILNNMDPDTPSNAEAKENLNNLLNGINSYLSNHQDTDLRDILLTDISVKERLNNVIKEIYNKVREG